MSNLKPNFIPTARAFRRHTDRRIAALVAGKRTDLITTRCERLTRLYLIQIKIPA
jgi:hypothetical protein